MIKEHSILTTVLVINVDPVHAPIINNYHFRFLYYICWDNSLSPSLHNLRIEAIMMAGERC